MKTKIYFLPLLLLPLLLTGCFSINEEFESIRDNVINNMGDQYNSEFQFSIGSVGITVSSWIIDSSSDDKLPAEILEDVSSVQVGVYKKFKGNASPDITTIKEMESNMQQSGWKSIVKSSSEDKLTAVYIRKNSDELLERLFVISLDGDELVLVEVEGDLKEAISTVIKEKGRLTNL